jgi:hypothetical protein
MLSLPRICLKILSVWLGGLITEVCCDYGLKAFWDGSIDSRVNVELDWERRLLVS